MGTDEDVQSRWERRSGIARALRIAVFAVPVLASFGVAIGVRLLLPPPEGISARVATWMVLALVSTLALVAVDRLAQRLLPLVTLFDLSMLFPDRAPSRLSVARDAMRRTPVEEQLRRVQQAGADPSAAARQILALVVTMSLHDRPTRGHAERVRMYTDLLADQMRLPQRDRDLLRWASILHDVGKLRVSTALLNKPGKPSESEWAQLKAHPAQGAELAAALLPWLGEWGAVIVQHHERYDGTGYPHGLVGQAISRGARIVSVADAYDVMTAARAYRRPVSRAAACRELVRFSGTQFDPDVVRAMVAAGAPRLRRAQGLVAGIANIRLVSTGAVRAATMARVVGAGVLATGALTGVVALEVPVPTVRDSVEARDAAGTEATGAAEAAQSQETGSPPRPACNATASMQPGADASRTPAPSATTELLPAPEGSQPQESPGPVAGSQDSPVASPSDPTTSGPATPTPSGSESFGAGSSPPTGPTSASPTPAPAPSTDAAPSEAAGSGAATPGSPGKQVPCDDTKNRAAPGPSSEAVAETAVTEVAVAQSPAAESPAAEVAVNFPANVAETSAGT